jgi:type IX secretion system PorP/SprF family membrane protein
MKAKGKRILLVAMALAVSVRVWSQQDPLFSHYMFNEMFNNPAYAGVEGTTNLTFLHRSQWLAYTGTFDDGGAPTTQLLSLSTPLMRFRSGVGFFVANDRLGAQNNLQIQASYAYHLAVFNGKMSFGVRAGMFSQSIDFTKFRAVNPSDPILQRGRESQFRPDLAVGVYYKTEKYYGGLSLNHLIKSSFDFGIGSDSLRNALETHLLFTAGYSYELNYDLTLRPSVLVRSDFNTYSFDVTLVGVYREKYWGGLSYRQSEAVVALLGLSMLKDNALKLGYSLDYVVQAQAAKQKTSHELLLSYSLPALTGGGRKIIRTPRFRH